MGMNVNLRIDDPAVLAIGSQLMLPQTTNIITGPTITVSSEEGPDLKSEVAETNGALATVVVDIIAVLRRLSTTARQLHVDQKNHQEKDQQNQHLLACQKGKNGTGSRIYMSCRVICRGAARPESGNYVLRAGNSIVVVPIHSPAWRVIRGVRAIASHFGRAS